MAMAEVAAVRLEAGRSQIVRTSPGRAYEHEAHDLPAHKVFRGACI
jgi:hypothetical protein